MEVELRHVAADRPAGVARVDIVLDGVVVGDLDWRACLRCRVGVIEQVRVDHRYRGHGYARRAVLAVRERAPGCTWSTTAVSADAEGFWAAFGDLIDTTTTRRCPHMADDLDAV